MKKLKLFFACLLMAVLSIGQVWAAEATLDAVSTKEVVTTAGGTVSKEFDGVTCLIKRNSSNQPGFYTSSGIVRYYSTDVMTLSVASGNTISQIDFVMTSGSVGTASEGTLSSNTWTGNAESVSFTGGATVKISSITVTYSSGGSTKTLSSVAVSGTPTKTEYYAGQDFDPAGLTVTGTYSDASQQTFTSGITWAYNPSQTLALNQTSIGVTATVSEITSEEFTVNGLTVTEAPAAASYEKVTAAPSDWSGEYLIVYENGATAYVWTGVDAVSCYATATISNDVIAQPEGTSSVTIASMEGGYSILVNGGTNDGKYIQNNGTSNGIKFVNAGVATTLTYENNAVTITCGGKMFRYNNASGNDRFRYFGSAQQVIQLYKKVDGAVKPSAGLAFDAAQKLAKVAGTLTAPNLSTADGFDGTVTYASSDEAVVKVNASTGAITEIVAVGKAVITAHSDETENFREGSASYTIFVAEQAGTNEDPLTEASAKALIDNGCALNAHVGGTVVTPTYYSSSQTYTVTLTDGFQFYKLKDLGNELFTSDYLKAGDQLVVLGPLGKHNTTYQLGDGCYLTSYTEYTAPKTHIISDIDNPITVAAAIGYIDDPVTYDLTDDVWVRGVVTYIGQTSGQSPIPYIDVKDADAENSFRFFNYTVNGSISEEIQLYDILIAVGKLDKHNTTYELNGCEVVDLDRPAVAVTEVTVESTASVAVGGTVTLHAAVVPENASNKTINWSVQSGNAFASVADGVVTGIAEGTAVIRAASDEDASIYAECTVTVAPLSPWASVYTSNIELSTEGGTSASAAKVKFYGEEGDGYDAIKAGTGSNAGAVVVNVPAGATALHFHAYGWNSESVGLTVTAPTGVTVSPATEISINSNSGIANNSPFTLAEGSDPKTDAYYAVSLSGNTEPVALTISATAGKRFVLFGVNQEGGLVLESIAVSGTASVLEYNDGDHFNPTGLVVTGHYSDDSEATISEGIDWTFDPDPLTEGTTSVSVTATVSEITSAAFPVNGLTVNGAAPLSPWATTWTSNLDDITGSKVKFYGEETEYAALKAGTGSVAGTATLNIPAQATELHLHAYGWNSEDVTLSITAPDGVTVTPASINLNRNSGFANNSPFTLAEGSTPQTDAYYALSLSGNTDAIELTISATEGKRFLLFGVNQVGGVLPELQSIAISGDLDNKSYKAGQALDMTGLTVTATYQLGEETPYNVDITNDPGLSWTYDPLVENQTEVTVTAHFGDPEKTASKTIEGLTVTSADPKIYVEPSLTVNFGSVEVGEAVPANKTITVTLTNVAAATATLGGTNAEAFSIDKTALVDGDVITISVIASTAAAASYSATITITDDAAAATEKVVNLSFAVTEPVVEETPVSTTSKWVPATEIANGMQVLITGVKDEVTYAMGGQNNNNRAAVAGTLNEGVFTPGENTMAFTVVAQGDGTYALRTSNGQYLYAASSSKNYLRTQEDVDANAKWTLTVSSAAANGANTNNTMFFNGTNSPKIFSCYASSTTTQLPIALYVPKPDYTREVTNGHYGTICLPNGGEISGATLFDLDYYDGANTLYLLEVNGNAMVAGRPYIFLPSATTIEVFYTGEENAPAGTYRGLVGSYTKALVDANVGYYILLNNQYWYVNSEAYVGANRAYIHMASVPTEPTQQSSGAPRRRVAMTVNGKDAAQGIEDVQGDNVQSTKVLINGNLYILRGEKVYDATGRLVK